VLAQSSCSSSAPRFSCIPAASIPSVTYWRYLLRGAGHGFLTHPSIQIPIRGRDGFSEPNLTDGETLAPTFTTFLFGVKLATILVRGRGPLLWTAFTRLPFKDSYLFFRTKWSDRTQSFLNYAPQGLKQLESLSFPQRNRYEQKTWKKSKVLYHTVAAYLATLEPLLHRGAVYPTQD